MNNCVICGRELPFDMTQLGICTKERGIEAACLYHEGAQVLKDYIMAHGGADDVVRRLYEEEAGTDG